MSSALHWRDAMPTHESGLTRRDAITRSAALAATLAIPVGTIGSTKEKSLRVGVIGCGVRGKYLIANLPRPARIVSLCDSSQAQIDSVLHPEDSFAQPLKQFLTEDAPRCSRHQDYRRMIEREELDAVIVAAPDHHHALATVLACRAGLHVYVEKPLALTIAEGRAIVATAAKSDQIVQVGSQQRTMQVNRFACEFVRDGGLGKVSRVEVRNFPGPMPYDPHEYPPEQIPEGMDWDLFCGPTPVRPYNRKVWVKDAFKVGKLTWRGWDLFRDYSGHLTTNWGAHSIDMVQYALGKDRTGPVEIWPESDQIDASIDDEWKSKTPQLGTVRNQQMDRMRFCPISLRYADGVVLRLVPGVEDVIFHGEKGKLRLRRNHYETDPEGLAPPVDVREQAKWDGAGHVARPHLENWLKVIGGDGTLTAPSETGHRSATVCHLINICRELGRRLRWDPDAEIFLGDDEANRLLDRPRRRGFELPA